MNKVNARRIVLAALLAAGCQQAPSTSDTESVMNGRPWGEATQANQEVFIYYANESRPTQADQANRDYVVGLMNAVDNAYVKNAAAQIVSEQTAFASAVDTDIANLTAALCGNAANTRVSLVIFDNQMMRQGQYKTCAAGQPVQTITEDRISALYASAELSDFRLQSAPLTNKNMLALALQLTSEKYAPANYSYTMVQKSHGSIAHMLSVRVPTRGDLIRQAPNGETQFKNALMTIARAKVAAQTAAVRTRASNHDRVLEALSHLPGGTILGYAYQAERSLTVRLATWAGLLKDDPMKDDPMKDDPMKDDPMKDDPMKDDPMKDDPMKDTPMNSAIMSELFATDMQTRAAILANATTRAAVMGDELLRSTFIDGSGTRAYAPPVLDDEDLSADAVIAQYALPDIGTSKADWAAVFAGVGRGAQRMSFNTVFLESCQSLLTDEVTNYVSRSAWTPNIGTLFQSDERGISTFSTIDYRTFLAGVDFTKPFAPQFTAMLNVAAQQTP